MRAASLLILPTFLLTPPAGPMAAADRPAEEMARSVTIYRDVYGVPHVFAATDARCVFGFAYAQAEDNFAHLEDNFVRALGRAAEVHGEEALRDDQLAPGAGDSATGPRGIRAGEPPHAGVVQGLRRRAEPLRGPALAGSAAPAPPFRALVSAGAAAFQVSPGRVSSATPVWILRNLRDPPYAEQPTERPQGSNTWALGPGKSSTGHPMLLMNPHVPFFGLAQYYEGHLHSEEGWNLSGVSRYGFPFPYIGHNEVLGWSHTDNSPDHGDLYVETFDDPAHPLAYRYGDGHRVATQWTEEIGVKTTSGVELRRFTFRKTHHGPILAEHEGKPVALKLAKLEEGGWFDQWYDMGEGPLAGRVQDRPAPRGDFLHEHHVCRPGREHLLRLQRRGAAPIAQARLAASRGRKRPADRMERISPAGRAAADHQPRERVFAELQFHAAGHDLLRQSRAVPIPRLYDRA